jgi:hypothetical protein
MDHCADSDYRKSLSRWGGLTLLLLLEGWVLSYRLSSLRVSEHGPWLTRLLAYHLVYLRIGTAAVAMMFLLGSNRLCADLEDLSERASSSTRWWIWYICHLIAFAGFAAILVPVLQGDPKLYPFAGAGSLLLGACGLIAAVAWINAVMPVRCWLRLLWRGKWVILSGLALGGAAYGTSSVIDSVWPAYNRSTLWLVQSILDRMGVTYDSTFAGSAPSTKCLGLIGILMGVYLWGFRHRLRFPQALLLVPLALALTWLANLVLNLLSTLVAASDESRSATELFFTHAAWPMFVVLSLGLFALGSRLPHLTLKPGMRESLP